MSETNTTSKTGAVTFVGCKLPNGLVLTLNGTRHELAGANKTPVIGGYGITAVPSDFWAEWKAKFKDFPPLKHNLLFEQTTQAKAEGQAKEQAEVKSGQEPLNPAKPAPGVTPVKGS